MKLTTAKNIERIKSTRYTMMPTRAIFDNRLTPKEKDLLGALAAMQGNKQYCWPSVAFLCRLMDVEPKANHRNMQHRLATLENYGYIVRTEKYHPITHAQMSNLIEVRHEPQNFYDPDLEEYISSDSEEDEDCGGFEAPPPMVENNLSPHGKDLPPLLKRKDEKEQKEIRKSKVSTVVDESLAECSQPIGLTHSEGNASLGLNKEVDREDLEEHKVTLDSPIAEIPLPPSLGIKKAVFTTSYEKPLVTPTGNIYPLAVRDLSTNSGDNPVDESATLDIRKQIHLDLLKRIDPNIVTAWYSQLKFMGLSDTTIKFKAPNQFVLDYMNNDAKDFKTQIIKSVKNCGKDIKYCVLQL